MATIHSQSYHHSRVSSRARTAPRPRRHSLDSSLPTTTTTSSSPFSLKHPTTISHMITPATTTTTPDTTFSLDTLQRHLSSGDFRQADEETRRLIIVLAGEAAIKRGYVFFSEVQFIPKDDLEAIDELWRKFSNGRFGYSVQRKIWLKLDKDFTRFFIKVGWMKKLDTEVEQFNYRAFPNEFIWKLNNDDNDDDDDVPPEGHLPLTNALRGTQLLSCILSHPAFNDGEDGESDKVEDNENVVEDSGKKKSRFATLRDKFFKPNYTF